MLRREKEYAFSNLEAGDDFGMLMESIEDVSWIYANSSGSVTCLDFLERKHQEANNKYILLHSRYSMSLYHEASSILTKAQKDGGSLKSHIFSKKDLKSDPKTLYALTTEAAKWSEILAEVVEKSGILRLEKNVPLCADGYSQLTPTLALLLTHDLFLSRKGIALPAAHGLNTTLSRHKARLSAELTKARLRRGFTTLDALREHINSQSVKGNGSDANGKSSVRHPRWIRINTIKTTLQSELKTTFKDYTQLNSLNAIRHASPESKALHVDLHIPDLVAIASSEDPTSFQSYKEGKLIFQEKASCFPAYLLNPECEGHIIDACAAPGNKTTHLAAILSDVDGAHITACEKDAERSKTLKKMVNLAGADKIVKVRTRQNFLKLDPSAKDMANVTALLLDPSCSGSGIVGRDEGSITVRLPSIHTETAPSKSKKRKRGKPTPPQPEPPQLTSTDTTIEENPDPDSNDKTNLQTRLTNLSIFQLHLLQHAMRFPSARTITYSTCSMHAEENENVVTRALLSDVAVSRGWKILLRRSQVDGMRRWERRGQERAVRQALEASTASADVKRKIDVQEVAEGCIRCEKGGEDGTMGFFVAGFVRDESGVFDGDGREMELEEQGVTMAEDEDSEWEGFGSDED